MVAQVVVLLLHGNKDLVSYSQPLASVSAHPYLLQVCREKSTDVSFLSFSIKEETVKTAVETPSLRESIPP